MTNPLLTLARLVDDTKNWQEHEHGVYYVTGKGVTRRVTYFTLDNPADWKAAWLVLARKGFKFPCVTVKEVDAWRWENWIDNTQSMTKQDENGDCFMKTYAAPEQAMLAAAEAL